MAKLSAHGKEVGRLERGTSRVAYMSDGAILLDTGYGWKAWRKLKEGVDPKEAYDRAVSRRKAFLDRRPALKAYYASLSRGINSLNHRTRAHFAVTEYKDAKKVLDYLEGSYDTRGRYRLVWLQSLVDLYLKAEAEAAASGELGGDGAE